MIFLEGCCKNYMRIHSDKYSLVLLQCLTIPVTPCHSQALVQQHFLQDVLIFYRGTQTWKKMWLFQALLQYTIFCPPALSLSIPSQISSFLHQLADIWAVTPEFDAPKIKSKQTSPKILQQCTNLDSLKIVLSQDHFSSSLCLPLPFLPTEEHHCHFLLACQTY